MPSIAGTPARGESLLPASEGGRGPEAPSVPMEHEKDQWPKGGGGGNVVPKLRLSFLDSDTQHSETVQPLSVREVQEVRQKVLERRQRLSE